MKALSILAVILATVFSSLANPPTLQELSSHLFTNAVIVWQAPTNSLPKSLWVYQRVLPHIFSATVISNGIVLGSLQNKGFPKPSTNQTCIMAEPPCPCTSVCNFFINPSDATMSFESPDYKNGSPEGIFDNQTIARLAWYYAPRLGLDPSHLIQTSYFTHSFNVDQTGNEKTNFVCGHGVFLARQLDGVPFFSADDQGDGAEGFSIQFGEHGQVRFFLSAGQMFGTIKTSQLPRRQTSSIASRLIKSSCCPIWMKKIILTGSKNWRRQRSSPSQKLHLVMAKVFLCETPTNDLPCEFATPFAELEAIADFGNSNTTIRFVSPLLSSEVGRLLGK